MWLLESRFRFLNMILFTFIFLNIVESSKAQTIGSLHIKYLTYGCSATWDSSDQKTVHLSVEAGYAIHSIKHEPRSDYGKTSLNVSYTGTNDTIRIFSEFHSRYQSLIDAYGKVLTEATAQGYDLKSLKEYKARLEQDYSNMTKAIKEVNTTYPTILVETSARGSKNPFDPKGASIKGTYVVTLIYLGKRDDLNLSISKYPDPRTLITPINPMSVVQVNPVSNNSTPINSSIQSKLLNPFKVSLPLRLNGQRLNVGPGQQLELRSNSRIEWNGSLDGKFVLMSMNSLNGKNYEFQRFGNRLNIIERR